MLQTETSPLRLNPVSTQGPRGEAGGVARKLTTVTVAQVKEMSSPPFEVGEVKSLIGRFHISKV